MIFQAFLLAAFALSVYEWHGLCKKTDNFLLYLSVGMAYIATAYGSFYFLREFYKLNVVLIFIGMIWFSDIGAYFTGKTLGGPKLIRKISPNKTWSGFGGALFFPAVFAVIWISLFGFHEHFAKLSLLLLLPAGFMIGLAIGCVGQVGDLLVSYVKRQAKVKDTGTIIPGHGGLLDRIDSMMLGAPVFLFLVTTLYYVL
ncbi:MAG: phosphatidate cytidylyltransferase [Alphaproteobacteria bacterium]|nr:phosphatidate cytidylyltransferase [Alphaproteobacteria bacterium]